MCAYNSNCVLLPTADLRQKYKITIMLKLRQCACAGLSALPYLFVAMVVADGIKQFLTRVNFILNSFYRKIQDDPEGTLGTSFS